MEFAESKAGKVVFARLIEEDDLLDAVTKVAEQARISTGFFLLIGTLKKAMMGFFREGKYVTIQMNKPLEIVSCQGNISMRENKTFAHAHIAVSDDKGRVFGGHVMTGCTIGVTGELVLVEVTSIRILREFDEKTRLYLWSLSTPSLRTKKHQHSASP